MNDPREGVALVLDSAPLTWTSQEDRHLLLCRELVSRGVRPVIIFSAPLKEEFTKQFTDAGAVVCDISYQKGLLNFYRELKQVVIDNNVTIAHIIFFDYFSPVAWVVRAAGIKRIIYEMQNSGTFRATSWKRVLLQFRTRVMTAPLSLVIAISEFVKEQLVKAGLPGEKIVVRYLGVDNKRFAPDPSAKKEWMERFHIRSDELILSTVSYLRPFKNPQVLVQACKELKTRRMPFRLFVGGDGEMLPSLKEQSKKLDVEEHIHWLGNVADPRRLLQASDIFLLASTGEAFGLVLTEAMACGVPVVGSRSGSLPEVVKDRDAGILFEPLNSCALCDAIEELATNVESRRHMGDRALDRVREYFTVERAVQNTLHLYEKLRRPTSS
jgi:glycosyltransferase involved in cell wall biosynthesis